MSKITIIGVGITGCSIARVLSKYKNLEVHLIEKESDVGWGATKANTGIIHAGHEDDPQEYPLRSKFCVRGNKLWHRWAKELDIPVKWPGELMIATEEKDFEILKKYQKIGKRNDVPELKIIDQKEIETLEPNATDEAKKALWAPTTGIIAPWEATIGLVENSVENGVETHFNTEVEDIVVKKGEVAKIKTNRENLRTDIVINAAGLYADEISKMAGIEDFKIHPRKGQYYLFGEDLEPKVNRILHPTPTQKTKGVYASQTVEGNLLLGPTAEDLSIDEKNERSTTEEGLEFVWNWSKNLLAELPPRNEIDKTFSGLRPEPPEGKYRVEAYHDPWGFVNVAGIRSPGLASAPAIAHHIEKRLIDEKLGIKLEKKSNWNRRRKGITHFAERSQEKKKKLIEKNPNYGKIICMCKEVSEAEIRESIRRMEKIGVEEITLDGIKFRSLAMFGKCQGSFCRIRIANLLSNELEKPIWEITQAGKGSEYGIGDVKKLQSKECEEEEND